MANVPIVYFCKMFFFQFSEASNRTKNVDDKLFILKKVCHSAKTCNFVKLNDQFFKNITTIENMMKCFILNNQNVLRCINCFTLHFSQASFQLYSIISVTNWTSKKKHLRLSKYFIKCNKYWLKTCNSFFAVIFFNKYNVKHLVSKTQKIEFPKWFQIYQKKFPKITWNKENIFQPTYHAKPQKMNSYQYILRIKLISSQSASNFNHWYSPRLQFM